MNLGQIPNENKLSLKDVLDASYMTNDNAYNKLHKSGYVLDKDLSTDNSKAYYNPENKKLLISYRGTQNLADVGTDAMLGIGQIRNTNRYKESVDFKNKAKSKYGVDSATYASHSLGGSLNSAVADKNDVVYSYNKGVGLGNSTKTKQNENSYRQKGDVVSILDNKAHTQKKTSIFGKIVTPYSLLGALMSHKTDNLKNNPIYI